MSSSRLFKETQKEIKGRLLRALRGGPAAHRRADLQAARLAARGLPAPGFLPDSVQALAGRSRRPTRSSSAFKKKFEIGVDRQRSTTSCSARTRRHLKARLRPSSVTAQQVRFLQAGPRATFKEAERRIGGKKGLGARGVGLLLRRRGRCIKAKGPRRLGQPQTRSSSTPRRKKPTAEGEDTPRGGQAAGRRLGACGPSGLHTDVGRRHLALLADDVHAGAGRGRRRFCVDSPRVARRAGRSLPSVAEAGPASASSG